MKLVDTELEHQAWQAAKRRLDRECSLDQFDRRNRRAVAAAFDTLLAEERAKRQPEDDRRARKARSSSPSRATPEGYMSNTQLQLLPDEKPIGVEIDLDIDALPSNATLVGPDPTPQFIELVQRLGVIQRIIVNRVSKPGAIPMKLQVLWGRRRVKAARALGLKSIPALLYELPPAQAHTILIADHGTRKENPAADLVSIRFLLKKGATEEEIVAATGLPVGVVKRRLKLNTLIEPFDKAFLKGKVSVAVAEALAKLNEPTQAKLYKVFEENGRLTQGDVAEERRAAVARIVQDLPFDQIGGTPGDDEGGGGRLPPSKFHAVHLTYEDKERLGNALMAYKEYRHNYSSREADAAERREVDALASKLGISPDNFQPEDASSDDDVEDGGADRERGGDEAEDGDACAAGNGAQSGVR